MAAAVSGGAHADVGAGPVSGLPSALAGVLNGSAEDTISLKSILEAVQNNQAVDIMETIAGNKLNSETMGNIIDKASEVTHLSTEQADQGNPGLNGKELQVLASLQKALAEGKVPAQSALGNRFRAEVDMQGKTPAEIKKFRLEWASNLMSQLEAKKIASKEWKRVDTTRFIYRPFGALVQHLGGWGDVAAIRGAATGALQCLVMGPPYYKKHPQTGMLNFAIAELSWEETFTASWQQAISYYTGDHKGAQAGPVLPPPPAPQTMVQANASASSSGKRKGETEQQTVPVPKGRGSKAAKVQKQQVQSKHEVAPVPNISPPGSARGDGGCDSERAKLAELFKKCVRIKASYAAVTARADEILREIPVPGGRLAWAANNDQGDRMVKCALDSLKDGVSEFGREVLRSKNQMDLKKSYDPSRLVFELTSFCILSEKVDKLGEICDGIVKMGQLMQSMMQSSSAAQ